ncbi:hypothetical protein Z043_124210, partial [Scleropages formosus]
YLTQHPAQLLIRVVVPSHPNSCNTLQPGLRASAIIPLQLLRNAAAHVVFNLPNYLLKWKTCYGPQGGERTIAQYLQNLTAPWTPARTQRCFTSDNLLVLIWSSKSKRHQFSVLTPTCCNELPLSLRTADSLPAFKKGLKTHFFQTHFPPELLKTFSL